MSLTSTGLTIARHCCTTETAVNWLFIHCATKLGAASNESLFSPISNQMRLSDQDKSWTAQGWLVFQNLSETIVFAKIPSLEPVVDSTTPKRLNLGKRVMLCFYNYLPGHDQDMVSGSKWFFGTKWGVCSWVEREVHLDFWGWEWDIVFEELSQTETGML